jgi:translation initiation factor IF-3
MANIKNKINEPRINDEIRGVETVRIVGDNIESREISLKEAKKIASNLELDLVEINGNVNPPIVKVVDYSKYMFELKKALKNKNKKKKRDYYR